MPSTVELQKGIPWERRGCPPGCMRFLVRFALLGALLLLFLLALAIQQHNYNYAQSTARHNRSQPTTHSKEPSAEEAEVRRILLLGGPSPDEGIPVQQQQAPVLPQQLETAVGAGLLFPIGRYPQGGHPGQGPVLTLNVAIVLVVSLLSIAVLITAICCVIIIALAMDQATSFEGENTSAADFLLATWPGLMGAHSQLDLETGGGPQIAKLFQMDTFTPPLTDDELEEDLEMGAGQRQEMRYHDREPLVEVDEPESGGSWPAAFGPR